MNYIVIADSIHEENDLLYDIAGSFWDAGNEVFIQERNSKLDYRHIAGDYYCIVLLISNICFDQCLFSTKTVKIHKDLELEMMPGGQPYLIFSENGVYSNAIPYPHKVFHFEKLARHEVANFFDWQSKTVLCF